jgi:hypothetical protein
VDKAETYRWLKFGDIKGETENTVVSVQDEVLSTKYFKKKKFLKKEMKMSVDHVKSTKKLLTT